MCIFFVSDTYDNKSYLGIIQSSFKVQGDKLVLVDLSVEDGLGDPKPFNYKDVEGYKEVDFSKLIPKKEDLKEVLSFHLSLFKETENTIKSKFGVPEREDYYGVKYLQYDNFLAFVSAMNPNEPASSIWTKDLLGMENTREFIISKFGPPEESGYDDEEMESYMGYSIENYYISFRNIGEQTPYIKIKKM